MAKNDPHTRHQNARAVLQFSLAVCTLYFICMATAHFFSFKYPILFIYWDTPFYAYQDKIISFCAAVYAIIFYEAFADVEHISGLAARSMLITVLGLSAVNVSQDLQAVLRPDQTTQWYWVQTALIACIGLWLTFWRWRAGLTAF
jgi:hypothetical protein